MFLQEYWLIGICKGIGALKAIIWLLEKWWRLCNVIKIG